MSSNASIKKGFRLLLSAIRENGSGKPDGWWDTKDIMILAGYTTATGASSKAKLLYQAGHLERMPFRRKTGERTFKMAYAYRPKDPKLSWDEICERHKLSTAEDVPPGWICVCDFARKYGISLQAIFQMVRRHSIPCRVYKVRRGFFGLKKVFHYKESVLCLRHKVKLKP